VSAAGLRLPRWNADLAPHYERVERSGMTMLRNARLGGVQLAAGALLAGAVLPLAPPTDAIGDAGWAVAAVLLVAAVAAGAWLLRTPSLSPELHLGLLYLGVATIAVVNWLAGGVDTPYSVLYAVMTRHVAVHPWRRAAPLMAVMVAAVCLPVAYSDVNSATAALMVGLVPALVSVAAAFAYVIHDLYNDAVARRTAAATARTEAELVRREADSAQVAAQRLRELDQMKEGFVSTVSHELRSPLTSVKGYLEAMLEGEVGELNDEQREYAEIVYRNSSRLQALVDDLLVLSRIEADKLTLEPEPFDLAASLGRLREDALAQLAPGEVSVAIEAPAEIELTGDRRRIEQAVSNLVSNAIKYGGEGDEVRIRAFSRDDEAVVEVIDHGVGIPAAELDGIGERFFRASTAGTAPGSGLGLAIARELVSRHGGTLEVESVEGIGSTFRVLLPLGGVRSA
jgi:signal transduction histidine kinase